jgi:hypothetical protein
VLQQQNEPITLNKKLTLSVFGETQQFLVKETDPSLQAELGKYVVTKDTKI